MIHVTDTRLTELIAQVSGDNVEDIRNSRTDHSVFSALLAWSALQEKIEKEEDPEHKQWLRERISTGIVIHGAGGWHRYYVRTDGRVVYSAYHGPQCAKEAVTAGFEIQD